jgi:hypothetical protein
MILDDLMTGFPIPWLSPSLKSNCFDNGNNYVVDRLSLLWSAILLGAEALSSGFISIATNTGWVLNTRFLLYLIQNWVVLHTNKKYCAQYAHSDTATESRYIIQRSIQESWIVVEFMTLF